MTSVLSKITRYLLKISNATWRYILDLNFYGVQDEIVVFCGIILKTCRVISTKMYYTVETNFFNSKEERTNEYL